MANINDSFPSAYLKASDLGTNQPTVQIDRIEHEPVGRDKEMKAVIYVVGKQKGLVLNKTNAKAITALVGTPETDEWVGFKIRLYATTTEYAGDTVECIRIKAAGPAQTNGNSAKPKLAAREYEPPTTARDHDELEMPDDVWDE